MSTPALNLTPLQELWLQRLENGTHDQARGFLGYEAWDGNPDMFCCLGVACQVHFENQTELNLIPITRGNNEGMRLRFDGKVGYLPETVANSLRLHDDSGRILFDDGSKYPVAFDDERLYNLGAMNDSGYSHREIAAFIRANPAAVFRQQ